MKKTLFVLILATMWIPAALASPTIVVSDGPGNTNGGLFNVVTSANGSFGTFCIETSEFLSFGTTYFYEISTSALYNNAPGNSDPISLGTAYLFAFYQTISGAGITPYANDAAHNDLIQQAIWYFESEGGGSANVYTAAVIAILGASYSSDANGAYGVYAMNLNDYDPATFAGRHQDLLVQVPDGGLTVMLLGLGLGGFALLSRKLRK
jgi:hypothetical protein